MFFFFFLWFFFCLPIPTVLISPFFFMKNEGWMSVLSLLVGWMVEVVIIILAFAFTFSFAFDAAFYVFW